MSRRIEWINFLWKAGPPWLRAAMVGLLALVVLALVAYYFLFPKWEQMSCEGDCVPYEIGQTGYLDCDYIGITLLGPGKEEVCGKYHYYHIPIRVENTASGAFIPFLLRSKSKEVSYEDFRLVDAYGRHYPASSNAEGCNPDRILGTQSVRGGDTMDLSVWFKLGEYREIPPGKTMLVWEPSPSMEPFFFAFNST
jgi:hypothetical protein